MSHKIGDRVRIKGPSNLAGKTATIYNILVPPGWFMRILEGPGMSWSGKATSMGIHPKETAYLVDVDGVGRYVPGGPIGFPSYWLEPLTPPAADTWAADKVRELVKPRYVEPVAPTPNKVNARFPSEAK